MAADKPTDLSRVKLKTWTRQPVPMLNDQRAISSLDPTASWLSHLALALYMFVVVNFDALAQASDIRIERRQAVFLLKQDSNPGCYTPTPTSTPTPTQTPTPIPIHTIDRHIDRHIIDRHADRHTDRCIDRQTYIMFYFLSRWNYLDCWKQYPRCAGSPWYATHPRVPPSGSSASHQAHGSGIQSYCGAHSRWHGNLPRFDMTNAMDDATCIYSQTETDLI